MKTQAMILTVVMIGLLGGMTCANADIYRWKDAQGNVHYSDKPVQGAERVGSVASHPSDPVAVANRAAAEQAQREKADSAAQEQQTNQEAAKNVKQDMAKIQAEQCAEAQKAYKTATESQRLYRIGKNGEREYLSDEELATTRINARKTLDQACGKQPG